MYCQPRYLSGWEHPELVTLKPAAGSVGRGPKDDRIKVVDAQAKALYDDHSWPPFRGARRSIAQPDKAGHFDALEASSVQFESVHAYAVLRLVLDMWESYAGSRVEWFFAEHYHRLEVVPSVDWENGQAGYGFIELGFGRGANGRKEPFALNFDVLAHEMGHILIASEVGIPVDPDPTQYAGFQEAASDLVALVALLQFDRFIKHLLDATSGNLYVPNALNRVAELSKTEQIRTACHSLKMSDIDYQWTPARALTQKQIHRLGQPFTGAMFDVLVEVFHAELVRLGAIDAELNKLALGVESGADQKVQDGFERAYQKEPQKFREALRFARDFLGVRLVQSWRALDVNRLTLFSAAAEFLTVDRRLSGSRYQALILQCLRGRDFSP